MKDAIEIEHNPQSTIHLYSYASFELGNLSRYDDGWRAKHTHTHTRANERPDNIFNVKTMQKPEPESKTMESQIYQIDTIWQKHNRNRVNENENQITWIPSSNVVSHRTFDGRRRRFRPFRMVFMSARVFVVVAIISNLFHHFTIYDIQIYTHTQHTWLAHLNPNPKHQLPPLSTHSPSPSPTLSVCPFVSSASHINRLQKWKLNTNILHGREKDITIWKAVCRE